MRNSPMRFCWKDGKLIGLAMADNDATQDQPDATEKELMRIFGEWKQLKAFAKEIVRTECWGYEPEVDGADIQEVAEKMGIITRHTATKEDADRLNELHGFGMAEGDPFYKFADWFGE